MGGRTVNCRADGLLGAIVASESLGVTDTLINGAGGCRSRAQIMMHDLIPQYYPENRGCCRSKYFSRQSRLPCTYLNNEDIIFGSREKVSDGIVSVSGITGRRVLLLDTLGASLICTDYEGMMDSEGRPPIIMDSDLSAMSFSEGYDMAMCSILSSLDLEEGDDGSVNIIGYGIMDPGWETGAHDLVHMLERMGLKVNCIPGCLPDENDVMSVGKASLNIMIHPEYCTGTARMLWERTGTPHLRPSMGAPVGYPAIRSFIREVADATGRDPTDALRHVDDDADSVHRVLMNYDRIPKSLRSKGFVVESDSSVAYPLMMWMMGTFGMSPRRISFPDEEYGEEISGYLSEKGFTDALTGIEGDVEAVFSDGMDALEGRLSDNNCAHIEVCMPRGRCLDLMGRTVVGPKGCRYILDELLNGITRFRCGQPTDINFRPGNED